MKLITEFKEFLTESLLLEANIKFSEEFRNMLIDIDDDVSYKLLNNVENRDIKTQINLIEPDLTNPANIKFYPDNRLKTIFVVGNSYNQYKGDTALRILKYVDIDNKDSIVNYFSSYTQPSLNIGSRIDILYEVDKSLISKEFDTYYRYNMVLVKSKDQEQYIFMNKENLNTAFDKENLKPSEIRIGRAVKQLLKGCGIEKSDSDIEKFVNKWKSRVKYEVNRFDFFKIVKGDDIRIWYHQNKYKKDGGTLNGSCMRYDSCQSYFDIYTKNTDVCRMLILTDDNDKLTGRALVWKLRNGETFMDRIYYINDSDVDLFKQYAKKENWYYKYNQNNEPNETIIAPEGKEDISDIFVDLDTDFKYYPYMDTLRYLSKREGYLTNMFDASYDLKLDDTEGSYACTECRGEGSITCGNCDGSRCIDCDRCDGRGTIDCNNCRDGQIDCSECDGTGNIGDDEDEHDCGECNGSGSVDCPECDGTGDKECYMCDGDGQNNCPECDGEGSTDCPECS